MPHKPWPNWQVLSLGFPHAQGTNPEDPRGTEGRAVDVAVRAPDSCHVAAPAAEAEIRAWRDDLVRWQVLWRFQAANSPSDSLRLTWYPEKSALCL